MSILKKSALAAALLSAATAVNATSAEVVLENLRFSVVDLDPNDGVEASFAFLTGPNGFGRDAGACVSNAGTPNACNYSRGYTEELFVPLASSLAIAGAAAHGEVFADGRIEGDASVSQLGAMANGHASVTAYDFTDQDPAGLMLGSNSRLVVSADYSISLHAENPWGGDALYDEAQAWVELAGTVQRTGFARQARVDTGLRVWAGEGPLSSFENGTLTLQLDNTFWAPSLTYFGATVSSGALSNAKSPEPPPIPEPSSGILMCAGLLVAAEAARRRKAAREAEGKEAAQVGGG